MKLAAGLAIAIIATSAHADLITVAQDGSGDYTTIQDAVVAANPGDQVLVMPGTYPGGIDFLGKAITIRSDAGASKTIVQGDGQAYAIRFENEETSFAVLEGFSITNATSSLMHIDSNASPDIRNCTFSDCITGADMVNIEWANTNPTFTNCDFFAAEGSNQLCMRTSYGNNNSQTPSTVTLDSCSFTNGYGCYGGGTSNSCCKDTIVIANNCNFFNCQTGVEQDTFRGVNCSFIDCYRGIVVSGDSQETPGLLLNGCLFKSCTRHGLELADNDVDAELNNCTFDQCSYTDSGSAIRGWGECLISGCTFTRNSAQCIYSNNSAITVSDSFFCENGEPILDGTWILGTGNEFAEYCPDTYGACCAGETCIETDAQLCDSAGGVFYGVGSYCAQKPCATPPESGACCINEACLILPVGDCALISGFYLGHGSSCSDGCPADCGGDTNADGVVDTDDILNVLSDWGVCP